MAQINQDLVIYSENDLIIRFEDVYNENNGSLLSVSDIIGASYAITPFEDDVEPIITKDLISGGITIPEDGIILVALESSDTIDISGEFTHELRLRHSGGIQTASRGKMNIKYKVANTPL